MTTLIGGKHTIKKDSNYDQPLIYCEWSKKSVPQLTAMITDNLVRMSSLRDSINTYNLLGHPEHEIVVEATATIERLKHNNNVFRQIIKRVSNDR